MKRFFELLTMFIWLAFMAKSDSYFVVYLLVGVIGVLCWKGMKTNISVSFSLSGEQILAVLFSICVIAANYQVFSEIVYSAPGGDGVIHKILGIIGLLVACSVIFLGGFFHAFYILKYLKLKVECFSWKHCEYQQKSIVFFGLIMFLISLINIIILFLCYYPGILTPDSGSQIMQIMNGSYSNHHPFYHTMVVRFWLKIGLWVFGDMNAAVATYSVFSILFMAAAFAYALTTIYEMKINRKVIVVIASVYALLPYHICFSMTMWKDVMFGACVLIFSVSLFRYVQGIGSNRCVNTMIMVGSALGFCLFRSNGFFAFVITFIAFCILYHREYRRICIFLLGVIFVSYILKHPVLEYLNVTQPDRIESLSVPAQQIARVITDCNDLTSDQEELLAEVIDVDMIAETYKPYISDPIKNLVRAKGNQDYLDTHSSEYLRLYMEIGVSHPLKYIEAWIDQTKGYWNGGNDYIIWRTGVTENEMGIKRIVNSDLASTFMNAYLYYFRNVEVLKLFLSIGLHTWIVVLAGYIGIIRKDKTVIFMTISILSIIASLLVATPVYSEFRYAYAMFCCMPFLLAASLWDKNSRSKGGCSKEKTIENNEQKEL